MLSCGTLKKINNNVALAKDESGTEWVLLGRGIGFGKNAGDEVHTDEVDRRFKAEEDTVTHQNPPMILANIDPAILQLASKVSQEAGDFLGIHFSNYNYLAIADHIAFALERTQRGEDYPNEFRWQVGRLYPKEYAAAKRALATVKAETGVSLPKSELTFFTYHFVSAQSDATLVEDTVEMTELINRVVEIVSYSFQMQLDTSSLNYSRFVTHLRYFVVRQIHGESGGEELDPTIGQVIRMKYPKAYEAAGKIAAYLEQARGWHISNNEKLYITLHVWRLTRNNH
ncbi:PRD domain-containing protein [Lacticaseibacillus thailandensis]|uniref:PRD domain-containing protein n=1 Tax=Lacticaseibacillus thailandensis TaxID=381741 RepID=UPI0006D05125|nr:PRD domain-containing protein [Lacticaseibacillus thailandensis]